MEVEHQGDGNGKWTVMKRYSSLRAFHKKLRKSFKHTRSLSKKLDASAHNRPDLDEFELPLPPFPPTKWFGNRAPKFVEERRSSLSIYLSKLLEWANVGQTADLRMRLLREYLTFSDPEIAAHRMFQGMQHGPEEIPRNEIDFRSSSSSGGETKEL